MLASARKGASEGGLLLPDPLFFSSPSVMFFPIVLQLSTFSPTPFCPGLLTSCSNLLGPTFF